MNIFIKQAISSKSDKNCIEFDVSDLNVFHETLKLDSNIELKNDNEIVIFNKHLILMEIVNDIMVLYLVKDNKRYLMLKNLLYEFTNEDVYVKGNDKTNKLSYYDVYFIITFEIVLYEKQYFSGCFTELSNKIKDYIDIFISNYNGDNKRYKYDWNGRYYCTDLFCKNMV